MRRMLVLTVLSPLVWAAPAAAAGSGGAEAGVSALSFSVSPARVAPGAPLTFSFLAVSTSARVRARVDLLAPGRPAVRAKLGVVRAGRTIRVAWTPPALPVGAYTARLVVSGRAGARVYRRAALQVAAAGGGVFPVSGPYGFGGAGARFGAPRPGHVHQGQDIPAAEGTPVVFPLAGSVRTVGYQASGAGNYVVEHAGDGRDFVFMHLQDASVVVTTGQAVTAGDRLGAVGSTGESEGPHLHFEIWPDGWRTSDASQPVDPLPQLEAWAGA